MPQEEYNKPRAELEPVTTTLEDYFHSESRHLRQMLMSSSFSGTPEERETIMKNIADLEGSFCQATIESLRENYTIDKGKVMPEWNKQYGFLKLKVYKICGYTRPENPYQNMW